MGKDDDMIYGMQMVFGFTEKAGWVLFESFKVEDGTQFFFALLLILAMAVATEALSFAMWYLKFSGSSNSSKKMPLWQNILSSLLYFGLRILNYCQMLVAMTFNFWLILSIAFFQFFAWYIFQDLKDGMVISKARLRN